MAANLNLLLPLPVAGASRPRASGLRPRAASGRVWSRWWSPIFGWSSEPDYIESSASGEKAPENDESSGGAKAARFAPGCFTAEKAKRLRMMTKETESFHHDVMYHSAIASRLALDCDGGSSDM